VDGRLRRAVDESVCRYGDICSVHGIGTSIVHGLWCSHGAPLPLHSAAKSVDRGVTVRQVMDAVKPLEHCSVADSFCSLELEAEGMAVLLHASWVHREPDVDRPPPMPPGWRPVATVAELTEWTGAHDTTGVLLPGLLERATFRIVARRWDGAVTAGAVAHLGTGVVGVSNVFDLDHEGGDWDEVVQVVQACFPGRPIVGYEWERSLTHALAAGFTTVGEHRVWFR
jgi:hypothetical protein